MPTNEFSNVMTYEKDKQIWDQLEPTYEGNNKVKNARIDLLL